MDNFFKNIKNLTVNEDNEEKARRAVIKLFKRTTEPNPSMQDMAELIMAHPEAEVSVFNPLDVQIHRYRLKKGDIIYKVEAKGLENKKVMEVDITKEGKHLLKYRIYDGKEKLEQKQSLSKEIFFSLFE